MPVRIQEKGWRSVWRKIQLRELFGARSQSAQNRENVHCRYRYNGSWVEQTVAVGQWNGIIERHGPVTQSRENDRVKNAFGSRQIENECGLFSRWRSPTQVPS